MSRVVVPPGTPDAVPVPAGCVLVLPIVLDDAAVGFGVHDAGRTVTLTDLLAGTLLPDGTSCVLALGPLRMLVTCHDGFSVLSLAPDPRSHL